ncbi:MAG: AEC family transporter [Luteolibacter sp.]
MISPGSVVASVLPVYLLLLAGAILRKTNLLHRENDPGILQVIYNVMLPCYIMDKVLGCEDLRSGTVVFSSIGIGFFNIALGAALGLLVAHIMRLEKGQGRRTFALASGSPNFGFTAVPVIESLWGAGALGLLFIHNLGSEVAMWSIGVMLMSGEKRVPWRKLVNGPVVAILLSLLLVATHLDGAVTGPLRVAISKIGIGAFPLTILITGCIMMDMATAEKPNWNMILGSSVVRFILGPAAILTMAKFLPLHVELKKVLIIQAAMPSALTTILLARLYGGRPAVAVQIIIATTCISVFTLPWIISWGCKWLNLFPQLR